MALIGPPALNTNPFVAQFWAEDPDGRLYLFVEIYMTHRLVEEHAKTMLAVMQQFKLKRPVAES